MKIDWELSVEVVENYYCFDFEEEKFRKRNAEVLADAFHLRK